MAADPGNHRAVAEARIMARLYRKSGYPEAVAAPEYCIDELGPDGFYTYTVSVYVGKRQPETMSPFYKRLMEKVAGK